MEVGLKATFIVIGTMASIFLIQFFFFSILVKFLFYFRDNWLGLWI